MTLKVTDKMMYDRLGAIEQNTGKIPMLIDEVCRLRDQTDDHEIRLTKIETIQNHVISKEKTKQEILDEKQALEIDEINHIGKKGDLIFGIGKRWVIGAGAIVLVVISTIVAIWAALGGI